MAAALALAGLAGTAVTLALPAVLGRTVDALVSTATSRGGSRWPPG